MVLRWATRVEKRIVWEKNVSLGIRSGGDVSAGGRTVFLQFRVQSSELARWLRNGCPWQWAQRDLTEMYMDDGHFCPQWLKQVSLSVLWTQVLCLSRNVDSQQQRKCVVRADTNHKSVFIIAALVDDFLSGYVLLCCVCGRSFLFNQELRREARL